MVTATIQPLTHIHTHNLHLYQDFLFFYLHLSWNCLTEFRCICVGPHNNTKGHKRLPTVVKAHHYGEIGFIRLIQSASMLCVDMCHSNFTLDHALNCLNLFINCERWNMFFWSSLSVYLHSATSSARLTFNLSHSVVRINRYTHSM